MHSEAPLIVGIGGTTRVGSTSEMALQTALLAAQGLGMRTRMLSGADLLMPAYEPGNAARSPKASALIEALRQADGVLISTPGYHGSMSGLIKNALDYTEDMRGDRRPYFDGRPVGCIVCADGAQAMGSTLLAMRSIVHALRGWPTPFSPTINSSLKPFGPDGQPVDAEVAAQLETVARQVAHFAEREQYFRNNRVASARLSATEVH